MNIFTKLCYLSLDLMYNMSNNVLISDSTEEVVLWIVKQTDGDCNDGHLLVDR